MSAPDPAEWTRCWRCGKLVRRMLPACGACGALRRRYSDRAAEAPGEGSSITVLMAAFALMLGVSLVYGVLTSFGLEQDAPPRDNLRILLGLEAVDVLLVLGTLRWIGRPPRWPRTAAVPAPLLWAAALVGLGVVLLINHSYHQLLRGYLRVSPTHDALAGAAGITPLLVVVFCLQPAVIEELFFRYLALDNLRSVMSVHLAVGVSSLMFGLAHIGVPLSIPVLALIGVALGYARVLSGRLVLPMLLHFLHNGLILLLE